MTRTRHRFYDNEYPYFMTCTVVGWQAVFTRPEAVQIVFDSWDFLKREKGLRLYGYVILENHLHLIASAPDLSNAMKSFKMYTARQIIDMLERHQAKVLLHSSPDSPKIAGTAFLRKEPGSWRIVQASW
jgi:putative transposase